MRTIRLPIAIAGCLCGLAALPAGGGPGGAARAWAAVIVIDNRTPDEVRFSVQSAGAKGTDYRLQPGQVLPLHVEEKVTAAFVSEGVTRRKPLEPNAIYSFQALPGGVDLERTKFPRKAQRQPPLEPALATLGRRARAPDFGPSEVIGIKILVDEEQKATRQKWEADLRRAIKAASDVIERHCGLRFEIQSIDAWQSDDRRRVPGNSWPTSRKKSIRGRPGWRSGLLRSSGPCGGRPSATRRRSSPRTFCFAIGRAGSTRRSASSNWSMRWDIGWGRSTAPIRLR